MLILMLYSVEPNSVDDPAEACCAQPILEDYTQSKLARTHDGSVAEATHGYLNKAANSNVPRPSQDPTDSPTHFNSMSSFKTPKYAHPLVRLALISGIAYSTQSLRRLPSMKFFVLIHN